MCDSKIFTIDTVMGGVVMPCSLVRTELHGVIFQKIALFIFSAKRTSNPIYFIQIRQVSVIPEHILLRNAVGPNEILTELQTETTHPKSTYKWVESATDSV
jgi:hypothetical protein